MNKKVAVFLLINLLLLSFFAQVFALEGRSQSSQAGEEPQLDNIIGGRSYSVAVEGSYAYLAIGSRIEVLDIQDPTNPVQIGYTEPLTTSIQKVYTFGDYLLALADDGVHTVDVTDKSNPLIVGYFPTLGDPRKVAFDGNLVYLTERPTTIGGAGGGMHILDYTNPSSPVELSVFREGSIVTGIALHQSYAYIFICQALPSGGCSSSVTIVDVSNPSSPSFVSLATPVTGATGDLVIAGNYLFLTGNQVNTYDISNPTSWTLENTIPGSADRLFLFNLTLYTFNYYGTGAAFYDVSDPTNPTQLGTYSNYVYDPYSEITDVVGDGVNSYATFTRVGLDMLDNSLIGSPDPKIGNYFTFEYVADVDVVGDYLYVADNANDLHILDVSTPLHPTILGAYEHNLGGKSLQVEGDTAYLLGDSMLDVIDVTNPEMPARHSVYDPSGGSLSLGNFDYKNGYGFLSGNLTDGGLNVVDLSDVNNPVSVVTVGTDSCRDGRGFEIVGDHLFLVEGHSCTNEVPQLTAINIAQPTAPQILMGLPLGYVSDLAISGDYAYLYSRNPGEFIKVVDISDPSALTLAASVPISTPFAGSTIMDMEAKDGVLYMKNLPFIEFKYQYSLADPINPTFIGDYSYELGLNHFGAIYDPNYQNGLYIYSLNFDNQVYVPFVTK